MSYRDRHGIMHGMEDTATERVTSKWSVFERSWALRLVHPLGKLELDGPLKGTSIWKAAPLQPRIRARASELLQAALLSTLQLGLTHMCKPIIGRADLGASVS